MAKAWGLLAVSVVVAAVAHPAVAGALTEFVEDFEGWPLGPAGAETCAAEGWRCDATLALVALDHSQLQHLLAPTLGEASFAAPLPPGTLAFAEVRHRASLTATTTSILRVSDLAGRQVEVFFDHGVLGVALEGCGASVDPGWSPHNLQWYTYRLDAGPPAVFEVSTVGARQAWLLPCLGLGPVAEVSFGLGGTSEPGERSWDDVRVGVR